MNALTHSHLLALLFVPVTNLLAPTLILVWYTVHIHLQNHPALSLSPFLAIVIKSQFYTRPDPPYKHIFRLSTCIAVVVHLQHMYLQRLLTFFNYFFF